METPSSSSRRITRSQAMAANNTIPITSWKKDESEKAVLKSRRKTNGGKHEERDRSALIDITNDSPIVGLAIGNLKTPLSSTFSKKRMISESKTSGSGEALLRGQVKTLLQKVEEEALISKISFEPIISIRKQEGFAPTPANTPQVYENMNNFSESLGVSPIAESFNFSQMLDQEEENGETEEKSPITRLLFTDSTEKFQENEDDDDDDDDASLWSLQVNACTTDDEHQDDQDFGENYEYDLEFGKNYENDQDFGENYEYDLKFGKNYENDQDFGENYEYDLEFGKNYENDQDFGENYEYDQEFGKNYEEFGDDEFGENNEGVDELCEGLSKICVNGAAKFIGKHKRFVYDSDGELEGKEEAVETTLPSCFMGLSTPKGIRLRFS